MIRTHFKFFKFLTKVFDVHFDQGVHTSNLTFCIFSDKCPRPYWGPVMPFKTDRVQLERNKAPKVVKPKTEVQHFLFIRLEAKSDVQLN